MTSSAPERAAVAQPESPERRRVEMAEERGGKRRKQANPRRNRARSTTVSQTLAEEPRAQAQPLGDGSAREKLRLARDVAARRSG
ncbi:hypothetical protein AOLI_G00011380 [Acnodon oligacanthus]